MLETHTTNLLINTSENADTTATAASDISSHGNLEIHVELPSKHRDKKTRSQQDLELALKRKFNRDRKENQLLMHKASLLCHFGRTYFYNRLLNDTILMQKALKLLPSNNAYPPDRGTEIKYYQSLVTWFKSAINLTSQNLYPDNKAGKTKVLSHRQLLQQIEMKQSRCKQDMVFIFIILLRGMGLQCRLVYNMQPLPLKPAQNDLISIKVKQEDKNQGKGDSAKIKVHSSDIESDSKNDDKPSTSFKAKTVKQEGVKQQKKECQPAKPTKNDNASKKDMRTTTDNSKQTKDALKGMNKNTTSSFFDDGNKRSKEKSKAGPKIVSTKKVPDPTHSEIKSQMGDAHLEKETKDVIKRADTTPSSQQEDNQLALSKSDSPIPAKTTERRGRSKKPLQKSTTSVVSLRASEEKEQNKVVKKESENEELGDSSAERALIKPNNSEPSESTVQAQHNIRIKKEDEVMLKNEELENSQKENSSESCTTKKTTLVRLKRTKATGDTERPPKKKPVIEAGSPLIPTIVVKGGKEIISNTTEDAPTTSAQTRVTRSRSKSPQIHISSAFLQTKHYKEKFPGIIQQKTNVKNRQQRAKSPIEKPKISPTFLTNPDKKAASKRILRSCQKTNEGETIEPNVDPNINSVHLQIPQIDGANDEELVDRSGNSRNKKRTTRKKKITKEKSTHDSDEDFEPSPIKKPKIAPSVSKRDRRVLSTDEDDKSPNSPEKQNKANAGDLWVEVWSDVEEQWFCVDLFKGKIHCLDSIRKSASSNMAYVFAFQNDLSIKDVTARYNPHWTTVVRKSRVDKSWLDTAIHKYLGHRTKRDIKEDQELRRIHEQKPMPTSICDYKNHPFYALERHLLKFEAIYPPTAPTLGYIRGEAVYSRDCVHTLHSREIWLKQARVVKLGEKPYKIVKARPKWDRITQTVIKDQPLEIFGYWQTEEYDPPTAENGLVPRNAYGNVELFKPTMLPKKCVHIRLPGLNRICKKLGIDCANAVIGFDFHQGACHPTYDGFVVCEEFHDQVTAAWYQDQEEQERKIQEKYEARVYGNWKKLIRGLLIRERLKLKYDF